MPAFICTTCQAELDALADVCGKCEALVLDWLAPPAVQEQEEEPVSRGRVRWIVGVSAAGILGVLLARACGAAEGARP